MVQLLILHHIFNLFAWFDVYIASLCFSGCRRYRWLSTGYALQQPTQKIARDVVYCSIIYYFIFVTIIIMMIISTTKIMIMMMVIINIMMMIITMMMHPSMIGQDHSV